MGYDDQAEDTLDNIFNYQMPYGSTTSSGLKYTKYCVKPFAGTDVNYNKFCDREGTEITELILHHTVIDTLNNNLLILAGYMYRDTSKPLTLQNITISREDPSVSIHYIVPRDADPLNTIAHLVDEKLTAYHAGTSYWKGKKHINKSSIGIEIVNDGHSEFCPVQMNNLVKLVADIVHRNKNITAFSTMAHADIGVSTSTNTTLSVLGRKFDPSGYFNWHKLYTDAGNLLLNMNDNRGSGFKNLSTLYENIMDNPKQIILNYVSNKNGQNNTPNLHLANEIVNNTHTGNLNIKTQEGPLNERTLILLVQHILNKIGYAVSETGIYDIQTYNGIETYNRHYVPSVFTLETVQNMEMKRQAANRNLYAQTLQTILNHAKLL